MRTAWDELEGAGRPTLEALFAAETCWSALPHLYALRVPALLGFALAVTGLCAIGVSVLPLLRSRQVSVPQVLRLSNQFLPASQTTRINYQLNLPQLPKTANYQQSQAVGSELLRASDFMAITPDTAATTGLRTAAIRRQNEASGLPGERES